MILALLLFCQLSIECDNPQTVRYIQAEYDLIMEVVEAHTGRDDMPALTISCPGFAVTSRTVSCMRCSRSTISELIMDFGMSKRRTKIPIEINLNVMD